MVFGSPGPLDVPLRALFSYALPCPERALTPTDIQVAMYN